MSLVLIFFNDAIYAQRSKGENKKSNKRSASSASKISGARNSSLRSASSRRQASVNSIPRNVQYIEIEDEINNTKSSEAIEKCDEKIKVLEEKYNEAMKSITSYQEQFSTLTTLIDELKIKVAKSEEVADKFYPKGRFVLGKTIWGKGDRFSYSCTSLDGKETLYKGKCLASPLNDDSLKNLYLCSYYQEVCEKGLLVKGVKYFDHPFL